jgi:hypothetical protein
MITKELIEDAKAAGFLYDKKSGRLYLDINDGEYEEEVTDKLEKLVELQSQRERQAVPSGWKLVYNGLDCTHMAGNLEWLKEAASHTDDESGVSLLRLQYGEPIYGNDVLDFLSAAPSPVLISPHHIVEELTKE